MSFLLILATRGFPWSDCLPEHFLLCLVLIVWLLLKIRILLCVFFSMFGWSDAEQTGPWWECSLMVMRSRHYPQCIAIPHTHTCTRRSLQNSFFLGQTWEFGRTGFFLAPLKCRGPRQLALLNWFSFSGGQSDAESSCHNVFNNKLRSRVREDCADQKQITFHKRFICLSNKLHRSQWVLK